MTKLDKLQEIHSELRKAKYFYYEKHESIMSDYDFDMLEKEYLKLAEEFGLKDEHNVVKSFVGYDIMIPMNLKNFYERR